MKRIISLFLLLCLTTNSFASVGGVQKLERIVDDFNYVISVEWDQKDQSFYQKESQKFFTSMKEVIEQEGLSKGEVLTLIEKRHVNKQMLEALKLKFSLLSQSDSPEILASAIKDSSKDMYVKGANWNGEIVIPLAIGIVIIAVLAYKWWYDANHKCVAWEERYDCETSNWDDRSCSTREDSDGNKYEDCDYSWQKEVTTTCGMMNFCTETQKI